MSFLGLALVLLAGCVVTSIYPYYTAKDLVFDPVLLGTWSDPTQTNADKETGRLKNGGPGLQMGGARNSSKTNEFDAHLFTLGNTKFLDALPRERHEFATPSHILLRVTKLQPQLEMQYWTEWLTKLVETTPRPSAISSSPNKQATPTKAA